MTLKMYQVVELPMFFNKIKQQKLPFKTAYQIALLMQEVDKHHSFYQEQYREILMEYGKKDEQGKFIQTTDGQGVMLVEETLDEAYAKFTELRDLDVILPDINFVAEAFEKVEFTPEEMMILLPFIKE
jgi:hypothetical protein